MSTAGGTRGPPPELVAVVRSSPLPTLLLDVPSEEVVAASPAARELLAGGRHLEGHRFEEFMDDAPSGALELLGAGRVTGYETRRTAGRGREPLQVWVRRTGEGTPSRHVLVVLLPAHQRAAPWLPPLQACDPPPVLGATGPDLLVERISSDAEPLLGQPAAELTGQSVLRLVDPEDASALLQALAHAVSTGRGVTLSARARTAHGTPAVWCQVLLVPLQPPPSVGFMVLPGDDPARHGRSSEDLEQLVRGFGRTIDAAATSRDTAELPSTAVPGLSTLSSRELDIVGRLLGGDRVPAIAKALFLSQSTVRNHLSAVFRKLHVSSQQELVELLRRKDGTPTPL